jgi:hypothetical protein
MDAAVINVIALTGLGGAAVFYVIYGVAGAAVRDGTLQGAGTSQHNETTSLLNQDHRLPRPAPDRSARSSNFSRSPGWISLGVTAGRPSMLVR